MVHHVGHDTATARNVDYSDEEYDPTRNTRNEARDNSHEQYEAQTSLTHRGNQGNMQNSIQITEKDQMLPHGRNRIQSVANLISSFSPRARARSKEAAEAESKQNVVSEVVTTPHRMSFGKLKRSGLNPTSDNQNSQHASGETSTYTSPSLGTTKSPVSLKQTTSRLRVIIPPAMTPTSRRDLDEEGESDPDEVKIHGSSSNIPKIKSCQKHPASREDSSKRNSVESTVMNTDAGHGFVDALGRTLAQVVSQLDSVDSNKLGSIRLGGELRGLLGKALDEFSAYEESFREHSALVGISISLQNLTASIQQVFPIIERLQTAKFMLNRQFKREVLFAYQEINSYYMSLFMELSMAIAKASGIRLPLPSHIDHAPLTPAGSPTANPNEPEIQKDEVVCFEADRYYFGHGQPQNYVKAFELYKKGAEIGSRIAMRCLGHMYMTGVDGGAVAQDLYLAEKWLISAAATDDLEATYLLGVLLCDHKATHQKTDAQKAATFQLAAQKFEWAAQQGHIESQYRLARLYETESFPGDADKIAVAMRWYRKAAENKHTKAQSALGCLLYYNSEHKSDIFEAVHFLQCAAVQDDTNALSLLGKIHFEGIHVMQDRDRAKSFLRRAVKAGNHEAMYLLGKLLLADLESSTDIMHDRGAIHDDALQLLLSSAHSGGIVEAFYEVGQILDTSMFLKDRSAALRYFIKAATATPPHAKAAKRAADMLYSGVGCVLVDKKKAHALYTTAADCGDPEALNALGLMYEDGDGCDLDFQQAAACYRKSIAINKNAHAHFNFGCLLAHGKGVTRNLEAAHSHFQKAAEMGYDLAKDFLPYSPT